MTEIRNPPPLDTRHLTLNPQKKPSKYPILVSAFICPGAGQGMQKRWIPAVIYGLSFIICFALFLIYVFRIIFSFYQMGFGFSEVSREEELTHKIATAKFGAVLTFISSTVIWLISLFDTFYGYLRACAKYNKNKQQYG